jgi:hypothetical protein
MSDLSPEARRLIDATRDLDAPGARDRTRLRAALYARLAEPTTAAATATKAAATGLIAKAAVGAAVIAVLGIGAMRPRPTTPTAARSATVVRPVAATVALPPSPPVERPAPVALEPVQPVERLLPTRRVERRALAPIVATVAIAPVPPIAPIPPSPPPPPIAEPVMPVVLPATPASGSMVSGSASPPATTVASTDPLASELRLLGGAQVAFDHHHGDRALRILDAYTSAHPAGALGVEALALRVLTLCALDRREEARQFAARLLREAPRSPSAGRVRSSCAAGDSHTDGDGRGH